MRCQRSFWQKLYFIILSCLRLPNLALGKMIFVVGAEPLCYNRDTASLAKYAEHNQEDNAYDF